LTQSTWLISASLPVRWSDVDRICKTTDTVGASTVGEGAAVVAT